MVHPGILIYDGECGLCRKSARWCRQRLHPDVGVVPSQQLSDEELAALGISRDDVRRAAWWIEEDEPPAEGAAAVAKTLVAMGGRQARIGRLLELPGARLVARGAYRWVAKNRNTTGRWLSRLSRGSRTAA